MVINNISNSVEYEKLTKQIYSQILKEEGLNNINVKHNVKIPGKSGVKHQIDVFWQHTYAGTSQNVIIECKYYTYPVSLIHVRNMLGLLQDIPNSTGIIVTTHDFQSGVKRFADFYGIKLKRIRPPKDSDWDGAIQIINIEGQFYRNNYINIEVILDATDQTTLDYAKSKNFNISFNPYELFLTTSEGNEIFIGTWLDKNTPVNKSKIDVEEEMEFTPENIYINYDYTILKLKTLRIINKLSYSEMSIMMDAKSLIHSVLEDFNTGEIEYNLNNSDQKGF